MTIYGQFEKVPPIAQKCYACMTFILRLFKPEDIADKRVRATNDMMCGWCMNQQWGKMECPLSGLKTQLRGRVIDNAGHVRKAFVDNWL